MIALTGITATHKKRTDMELQDRGGVGLAALQQTAREMAADVGAQEQIEGVFSTFRANVPQRFVDAASCSWLRVFAQHRFPQTRASHPPIAGQINRPGGLS